MLQISRAPSSLATVATSCGVPMVTHHRPRRPLKTDLVVLCVDQSGSMAASVVYAGIFAAVGDQEA